MKLKNLLFTLKQPVKRARVAWQDMEIIQRIPAREPERPQVLVVKLDVVGDFLVFQPGLRKLADVLHAKGQGITLVANTAVRALAEELVRDIVDKIIYVDARGRFLNDFAYRRQVLEEIAGTRYEAVYHPTLKRIYYTESLVRVANAPVKIGVAWQKRFSRPSGEVAADTIYTELVAVPEYGMFEYERLSKFWEAAAGFETTSSDFYALPDGFRDRRNTIDTPGSPLPFFCIFSAAGFAVREWSLDRFAELGRRIRADTGWEPVLCGGPGDIPMLERLRIQIPGSRILAGPSLSQADAMKAVSVAKLVVCNESGPAHMAAVMQTPALVLSNGNHYGWWNPYPAALAPGHRYVYPRRVVELPEKERCRQYGTISQIPMAEVLLEDALSTWGEMLHSLTQTPNP